MVSRREAALSLAFFMGSIKRPLRMPPAELMPEAIWRGSNQDICRKLELKPSEYGRLEDFRRSFSAKSKEKKLSETGIEFLARGDDLYPPRLAQIHDPPAGLFVYHQGRQREDLRNLLLRTRVALVGARAASRYGLDAAAVLAGGLSGASICVVSGMALGIDAAAHRGAIGKPGGSVAVLGCGVDVIYPRANRALYRELAARGAILSEYPPGIRAYPWRFPARNRIIAGLSRAVIVVEAREKSGALITADFCLEQGGEVCAVPGSIFSELSLGPNRLISEGATLVSGRTDILELLGIDAGEGGGQKEVGCSRAATSSLGGNEIQVLEALGDQPLPLDQIRVRSGVDDPELAAAVLSLELCGLVRAEPGLGYSRTPGRR